MNKPLVALASAASVGPVATRITRDEARRIAVKIAKPPAAVAVSPHVTRWGLS
jgi:hypothetical protein